MSAVGNWSTAPLTKPKQIQSVQAPEDDGFDDSPNVSPICSPVASPTRTSVDMEHFSNEASRANKPVDVKATPPSRDSTNGGSMNSAHRMTTEQTPNVVDKSSKETGERKRKREGAVGTPTNSRRSSGSSKRGKSESITPASKKSKPLGDTDGKFPNTSKIQVPPSMAAEATTSMSRQVPDNVITPSVSEGMFDENQEHGENTFDNDGEADHARRTEDMVKEILQMPMHATPEHLICPITGKIMKEPIFAEDGFTYERTALEEWIKARLPPNHEAAGCPLDISVPGPSGDPISMTFVPNKSVLLSVQRWRRRRKALKKYLKLGTKEPAVARRLRTLLEELRVLETKHFEHARSLARVEEQLGSMQQREDEAQKASEESASRIAELEATIRELTLQLEALRSASRSTDDASSLHQESQSLQQTGAALQKEAAEIRANLSRVWEESQLYMTRMNELREVENELEVVFKEMGDFSKGLLQKRHDLTSLNREREELIHMKQQLAQELCRNARMLDVFDPTRLDMLHHAGELGSLEALYLIGKYYLSDTDEKEKAQPYLKRVLESGRGDSDTWVQKTHYLCGLSYRNGLGIPIDNQLSFKHFLSAADHGYAKAQNVVGNIYNEVAGVVQRDVEMAFTYFQKSAAQGDTMAMFNLAILYQSDEVTAKDEARAFQLFKELAEHNDPDSMYEVSLCYQQGKGVAIDVEKAKYWMEKAVDHGYKLPSERNGQ